MQPFSHTLVVWIALVLLSTAPVFAENWPAWRGPTGDGVSTDVGLPIVWEDRIFVSVADGETLEVWSVDRTTGRPVWKRFLGTGNRRQRKQNMSSPSPVTDDEWVWEMTGTGLLKAFDFSGHERWRRDIPGDYGDFGFNWGYSSSPLLHDGGLYV